MEISIKKRMNKKNIFFFLFLPLSESWLCIIWIIEKGDLKLRGLNVKKEGLNYEEDKLKAFTWHYIRRGLFFSECQGATPIWLAWAEEVLRGRMLQIHDEHLDYIPLVIHLRSYWPENNWVRHLNLYNGTKHSDWQFN